MKSLKELTDTSDTGWQVIRQLLPQAKNKVEILPKDNALADAAVYQSQLPVQTTLGAVEYMSGGILIDNGWIRIIGSGSRRLPRSLPEWNKGKSVSGDGHKTDFYLAPDNLQWEETADSYADFLEFCFEADLNKFYEGQRWKNWHQQVDTLSGDRAFHIYPPLWSVEGRNVNKDIIKAVPIDELYFYTLSTQRQMINQK